eukprot:COSAG02_NODE_591_length_19862_cov_8.047918_6_plen_68_part_00
MGYKTTDASEIKHVSTMTNVYALSHLTNSALLLSRSSIARSVSFVASSTFCRSSSSSLRSTPKSHLD